MQQTRDVAIGLQMSATQVQITWFNQTMKEPVTASADQEENVILPMEEKVWRSACGMGEEIATLRDFLQNQLLAVVSRTQLKQIESLQTSEHTQVFVYLRKNKNQRSAVPKNDR